MEEESGEEEDEVSEDDKKKRPLKLSNKKGSPSVPIKRRASPHSLFPDDQSSDDDMGTSSARPKFIIYNKPPVKNTAPSYKERLEAKRKKSALDSRPSLSDDRKPLTITPPPAITQPSIVTPKQKLPNRAHLTSGGIGSSGSSSSSSINVIRPINTPPSLTKRYLNGPGIIKSIDEVI